MRSCEESVTRKWNFIRGTTANVSAAASTTWKLRSGIDHPLFQAGEKPVQFGPQFSAAREPLPPGADQPDQAVALVDGKQVILVIGKTVAGTQPVHKQRLY